MANSLWTTEHFTCPSCGMNYTATREEQHEKRSGNFKCSVCDTEIHAWSGYHDILQLGDHPGEVARIWKKAVTTRREPAGLAELPR